MRTLFLLFWLPLCLSAQDYSRDVLAVARHLNSLNTYSMRIQYSLFLSQDLQIPFQKSSSEVLKKGRKFLYKESDGNEFMKNDRYEIKVDAGIKSISVLRKEPQEQIPASGQSFPGLDKSLELVSVIYDNIQVTHRTGTHITYDLHLKPNDRLDRLQITIDKQKQIIERIRYYYKEAIPIPELDNAKHQVVFEIRYEAFATGGLSDERFFHEKNYLVHRNGKISISPKYKDYQLDILN
jgi:hypothetical protein